MKRFLAWAPWMVAACTCYAAQGRPASVEYGLFGVASGKALRVDDQCLIRPELLESWGWSIQDGVQNAFVIDCQGTEITLTRRVIGGVDYISLNELADRIDAGLSWRPKTDTAELTSHVRVVRVLDGHLTIAASLPIKPRITYLSNPERIAVDYLGATLEPDAIVDVLPGLSVSSPKPNDVRVVFPVRGPLQVDPESKGPAADFDFDTTLLAKVGPGPEAQPVQEALKLRVKRRVRSTSRCHYLLNFRSHPSFSAWMQPRFASPYQA